MRCIKPNGLQVAATFDAPLTLHQLRCCGVLEVTSCCCSRGKLASCHDDNALCSVDAPFCCPEIQATWYVDQCR